MKKSQQGGKTYYQAFDAGAYAVNGLSRSDVLEIKDAFDLIDTGSTGKIDPTQLRNLVKAYDFETKNMSLDIAIQHATETNKPIDFQTFLQVFVAYSNGSKSKETMRKVFRLFDDEKIGCISVRNLRRVVKEVGLQISENEIQQMVDRADLNNDGVITEDEFYLIMTGVSRKV